MEARAGSQEGAQPRRPRGSSLSPLAGLKGSALRPASPGGVRAPGPPALRTQRVSPPGHPSLPLGHCPLYGDHRAAPAPPASGALREPAVPPAPAANSRCARLPPAGGSPLRRLGQLPRCPPPALSGVSSAQTRATPLSPPPASSGVASAQTRAALRRPLGGLLCADSGSSRGAGWVSRESTPGGSGQCRVHLPVVRSPRPAGGRAADRGAGWARPQRTVLHFTFLFHFFLVFPPPASRKPLWTHSWMPCICNFYLQCPVQGLVTDGYTRTASGMFKRASSKVRRPLRRNHSPTT